MSNERFDALLAALAGARTRREMLAAVAVAATADGAERDAGDRAKQRH